MLSIFPPAADSGGTSSGTLWRITLLALLIVIGCVLLGFLFYTKIHNPSSTSSYSPPLLIPSTTEAELVSKEHAYRSVLEQRLAAATSPQEEAAIERYLAMMDMRVGNIGGGYERLREVAENNRYPRMERALAVQMMAEVYLGRSNRSAIFAKQYLFVGVPYASMAPFSSSTTDKIAVREGILQLYSHAANFASLPTVEYRLAAWYAQEAVAQPQTREESVRRLIQHFEAGNASFANFLSTLAPEDNYMAGQALWLKGHVAGHIARFTKNAKYEDVATSAFEEARASLTTAMNQQFNASVIELVWTDYRYAQHLVMLPKTLERDIKITELLNEVTYYKDLAPSFVEELRALSGQEANSELVQRSRNRVILLKGYSQSFDDLLGSLGYQ